MYKAEHSKAVRKDNKLDSKQARIGTSGIRLNSLLYHSQFFCSPSLSIARAGPDPFDDVFWYHSTFNLY
jgi:hypothetical protein